MFLTVPWGYLYWAKWNIKCSFDIMSIPDAVFFLMILLRLIFQDV